MKYDLMSTIGEIAETEKGQYLLRKYGNYDRMMQNFPENRVKTLGQFMLSPTFGLTRENIGKMIDDLNKPVEEILPEVSDRRSLDEIDRESFHAGTAPLEGPAESVLLSEMTADDSVVLQKILLDGEWEMAEGGRETDRLSRDWAEAIPATVPGSVHTALVAAGRIPDPTIGLNQLIAREESFKSWWFKRVFSCETSMKEARLSFGGVCNTCSVWLNGVLLGSHEGMFGGPVFDVTKLLKKENTLIVKLEPIPFESWDMMGGTGMEGILPNPRNNGSWKRTVVFNNVYGWHYSNLQALGIWRSVELISVPDVEMPDPFAATTDAEKGEVRLRVVLKAKKKTGGMLKVVVEPDNFEGKTFGFTKCISLEEGENKLLYAFKVPEARLWWPTDLGEQNLYRLRLTFVPEEGCGDVKSFLLGIRTVKTAPLPEGPNPYKYNWTFVINGKPSFVKGTGWCTMDPLMDFSRERYERFISLAHAQHIQMLRAWGSGMPETDDFYDLCSRYGIMVIQEWPTAWDSHLQQPYDMMEETVRLNTIRLRNYPSLVMWGGGNESPNPFGEEIDMMGRASIELDGTRPFHRGEGWGGSTHNYTAYWGLNSLQYNMTMTSEFFGEFGLACSPCYESIARYLPEEELQCPPPDAGECFTYHTPIFGTASDVPRLSQYARYFLPEQYDMRQFVRASQLSQATGVRHPLERARVRWPISSGCLYYKLNDNFPACSWSCVDWYGAQKLGYYIFQDAFAPLQAIILTDSLNTRGTPAHFSVYLVDDSDRLRDVDWEIRVTAFGKTLKPIKSVSFKGYGSIDAPLSLGQLSLNYLETDTCPLFLTSEVFLSGATASKTFYWYNFENEKGCMFDLPKTELSFKTQDGSVTVRNTGALPAVAVEIARPGHAHEFTVSDNFFWLNPGEEQTVTANSTKDLTITAWNT